MKRIKNKIKIAMLVIFVILGFSISNVASAGFLDKVYECDYDLVLNIDEKAASAPFLPRDMIMRIPISLSLKFYGRYANEMAEYYDIEALVHLQINSTPSWATASINPTLLLVPLSSEPVYTNISLNVKVDKDAIPFRQGLVGLKITVDKVGAINQRTFEIPVAFTPGFLPMIRITIKDNVKKINPMEMATFEIELENLGNGKTNIVSEVVDIPKGWKVKIPSSLILGTNVLSEDNKDKVTLVVKPDESFGYHDERKVINISLTPVYYDNMSLIGEKHILSFIVVSKGFSTPGFEATFTFILVLLVALIIGKWNRKYSVNEEKTRRRGGQG